MAPVVVICGDCHTVTEIHSPKLESELEKLAKNHEFMIKEQPVEVIGQCATCHAAT